MVSAIIKTLRAKYFIIPVVFFSMVLLFIFTFFSRIKDLQIFPTSGQYAIEYYTDKPNGGNSQVIDFSVLDSVIKFKFQLNDKFYSPYVGLSITPMNGKSINASAYNQINLLISSQNMERISISLYTPPLNYTDTGDEDQTLYHSYLNIENHKQEYGILISQFQFPDWWEDLHQLSENKKYKPDLSNLLHINIGSAFSPNIDMEKSLEIYSMTFSRNNRSIFITAILIYFFLVGMIFTILQLRTDSETKASNITVSYKPLNMKESVSMDEKCINYINNHYYKSNLTLEIIAKETATTPRRITQIINTTFKCNFKTYLNQIRINESKRLLTQTDLNMGEIAFKIGFNNQSHFNRVFKNEIFISPTEYREKNKSKPFLK